MKGLNAYSPRQLYADGLLGQYSFGDTTGLIGAGTTGEIFQFRWPDPVRLAAIRKLTLGVSVATAFAAPASALQLDVIRASAWTVQGTGGFVIDLSSGLCKARTQMPASLTASGDIRRSATSALGAGAKTLEAAQFTSFAVPFAGTSGPAVIFDRRPGDTDYPMVLAPLEGFVVKIANNPGTGTIFVSVSVEWIETDAR